jgi:hypothetical protein
MSRGPRGRPLIETGAAQARFVHFTGVPYWAESETHRDPAKIDHVFITFHAPPYGAVVAAVNTLSRLNRDAGFDGRVRLGILHSHWEEKPEPGLDEHSGLSYAALERETPVVFEPRPHEELAALLLEKTRAASRMEVWGELYARPNLGVHQIHSRSASCAVPVHLKNRDGALKFFFESGRRAETLLFKFDGQA